MSTRLLKWMFIVVDEVLKKELVIIKKDCIEEKVFDTYLEGKTCCKGDTFLKGIPEKRMEDLHTSIKVWKSNDQVCEKSLGWRGQVII